MIGWHVDAAACGSSAQPLTPQVIYKPATAGQRVGVVLRQFPKSGTLSSFDKVTLVLAKPLHGTVPKIVGLNLRQARAKLHEAAGSRRSSASATARPAGSWRRSRAPASPRRPG